MPKPKGAQGPVEDFEFFAEGETVDPVEVEFLEVTNISGDPVPLLSPKEVDFFNNKVERYKEEYKFDNIADEQGLDRLLFLELMVFRWSQWQYMGGVDYAGNPIKDELVKNIPQYSKEIREIQAALAVDKKTRESLKGGNTANFIHNLTLRAKQFGYHRNEQVIKSYNLWKELQGLVTLHLNSTKEERAEFNATADEVIEWIASKFDELDDIDKMFVKNHQKYWIRELN